MSTMKNKFLDLQEKAYDKIENYGVKRETIYKFEELFADHKQNESDYLEFAEKTAGYAMAIYMLSQNTGYEIDYLWKLWEESAQSFLNGESVCDSLEEEWQSFKQTTIEKDW